MGWTHTSWASRFSLVPFRSSPREGGHLILTESYRGKKLHDPQGEGNLNPEVIFDAFLLADVKPSADEPHYRFVERQGLLALLFVKKLNDLEADQIE